MWIGFELKLWRTARLIQSNLFTLPILVEDDKTGHEDPTSQPALASSRWFGCSDSENAKALTDNLQSQFQHVPVPPLQMDNVERITEVMQSFALAPASQPLLTSPTEVSKAITKLKTSKTLGSNCVSNRALRNLPRKAITFLTKMFNAVLKWQHYPAVWKNARIISLLNQVDPTLPTSYRPISLLDTVGKLCEKILFSRIMTEISSRGLLRKEQFGFRPGLSMTRELTW